MFSIGVKTAIRFFVCTLACQVATGTYIAPKQQVRVSSAEVPVLIALFDYSNSNRPAASPEMLIEESSRSSPTLRVQLLERLSSPERTRLLLTSRKPREFIETRKSDDSEALLHSFVVLEYADIELAQSAHRRLRDDPAIRWIDFASIVRAAVVPNDPLWPSSALSHTGEAQWGVRTMNFEGGWSITGGNAYVGVVDNGIEATGARFSADGRSVVSYFGVHEDLRQNFRGHWASNHVGGYADVDENPIYFEGGDYPFNRFAGHGTHVAGTIAASSNNRIGATGTCMNCSLIVAKVLGRVTEHGVPVLSTDAELVAGIAEVIYRGAQIVNLSLTIDSRGPDYCLLNQFDPVCVVLSMAQARDVVVVAASGNRNTSGTGRGAVAFPANDPRVVAVGGVQIDQAGKVSIWDERLPPIGYQHRAAGNTLIGSGFGPELEVVAPARDVLSTFYTRLDWFPAGRCGDSTLFVDPEGHQATSSAGEGYGTCTGTSMAAPHVSGLFGLMRSLDPLATTGNIRLALARGSCIPVLGCGSMNRSDDWGFGVPNAAMVLDALVNTDSCGLNNRLTPLFSLNSHVKDYFYTTVPQMALVALEGMIRPLASYFFEGPAVPGYPSLPLIGFQQPSAQLYVFAGSFGRRPL